LCFDVPTPSKCEDQALWSSSFLGVVRFKYTYTILYYPFENFETRSTLIVLLSVIYVTMLSLAKLHSSKGNILNNELKSISKEAIVSYFEGLSYLPEGTRVKHKKSEVLILKVPGEF